MSGIFLLVLLTGCNGDERLEPITPESIITMENVDEYLFRDDVQYVDLRNLDSRYNSGYIDGFENISFFDYLDYRVFDRGDIFEFYPDQLLNERELERLFDKDKAIFLYADGCIQSGYLTDVLHYLGYERVFVLGGFYEYFGDHLVLGTGDYSFGNSFYTTFTSQTSGMTYHMSGTFNMGRKIESVRFDIVDEDGVTLRTDGYDDEIDYNEQLTILEDFIVLDMATFNELDEHLSDPSTFGYDQIEGYEMGFSEDFLSLIKTMVIYP
jgi:rhodanese-related sulfurtransferase